jgi:ribosomal-protein-alanine N-acetyltransferase
MPLTVVNLSASDIPDVLDISVESNLCLWSAEAYRSEILRDDSIMLKLLDRDNGKTAGFAAGRMFDFGTHGFTVELTNIGLRREYRRQGNGAKLLRAFLDQSRSDGAAQAILEVRESNASAIGFYQKFGFVVTGRRKGFYSDPLEDGLSMRLALGPTMAEKSSLDKDIGLS